MRKVNLNKVERGKALVGGQEALKGVLETQADDQTLSSVEPKAEIGPYSASSSALEPDLASKRVDVLAKLSIIIINANYGRFLERAVDSALAQTVAATEVIVVDDGSTDGSRRLIERYGDRVKPVFKPAGGHVSAVNAGFEASCGDICIFLDADDYLFEPCVETILAAWRPAFVKVQYRLETVDADGQAQNMFFPYFPPDLNHSSILDQALRTGAYPWPVSSGNAFSRSFLERLLPIDSSRVYRSPDGYLNKLAPLYGQILTLHDVLGAYRVHGANAWAKSGTDWTAATAVRWLKFDLVLEDAFRGAAQSQGYKIAPDFRPSLQKLEYRMLAWRFAPDETPYADDNRGTLLPLGVGSVLRAANVSPIGRLVWIGWFTFLLYAPIKGVVWMFSHSRGQIGRKGVFRRLVAWSKGRADQKSRKAAP